MKNLILLTSVLFLVLFNSCGSTKVSPSDEIVKNPDKFAEFPEGEAAMKRFISENINYPEKAMERGEEGKVFIQFVVEKDGTITDIKVLKSVSPSLDKEAIRLVSTMPKWTPGIYKNKYVRSYVRFPINYILG